MSIKRFDHVGITVKDLDAATDFFVSLGMEVEGRQSVEGEFLDTVCGIPGSRTDIVMLRLPGGETTKLELATFVHPEVLPGHGAEPATRPGLRNVCFEVDDLQGYVDRLAAAGYGLVGGIGQYEQMWKMAYVEGPEGITVSLAEDIS